METVKNDCKHPDCKYRSIFDSQPACAYMMITGRRRGCDIKDCDKYESGKIKTISTLDGVRYENDV